MINGLNKIVATIGLVITTSVATFVTINAKTKTHNDLNQNNENELKKDKKTKDKKKNKLKDLNSGENNLERSKSIIDSCISRVSQWKQINGIPGLVIGVSLRGHNVLIYSEGFSNIENKVKCNDQTVMRIASISKSITALLLAKLMQENKIDIDLPIGHYLTKDQFPDKYWDGNKVDITVRQLASHLGGIRHYKKDNDKENESSNEDNNKIKTSEDKNKIKTSEDKNKIKTSDDKNKSQPVNYQLGEFSNKEYYLKHYFSSVTESLKLFKDDPLVAKPGTKFVYTTFGWTLISAVIETQLDGQPFDKYLIKFLREKLGMNYTYLDENEPIIDNRSSYYVRNTSNGNIINAPYVDNSYKWAGGGLLSNVYDLLKFGNIMLYSYKGGTNDGKKGFLNKEIVEQMWTPAQNSRSDWDPNWAGYGLL